MEDFTPSKNYRAMFKDARNIKNMDLMENIWDQLCSEIGLSDAATQSAGEALGKLAASIRNGEGGAVTAKKL
jgi:hypothetical protein